MTTETIIATNDATPSVAPREAHQRADREELIATCLQPRLDIVRVGSRYVTRVEIARSVWMSLDFDTLDDAIIANKTYIREATSGRVDPDIALKFVGKGVK
jgi:hypothetical protein